MFAIGIALVSIGAITALTWWLNKQNLLSLKVCAVCAGTAGTWLWMLAGIFTGVLSYGAYMLPIAILMGGSVAGIAYQSEKYLRKGRSSFLWKAVFIPVGFGMVWAVVNFAFGFVILGVPALVAVAGFFLEPPVRGRAEERRAENLERMMKDCC